MRVCMRLLCVEWVWGMHVEGGKMWFCVSRVCAERC